MPIRRTAGGYRIDNTKKVHKTFAKAAAQQRAIKASQKKRK